MSLTLQQLQTIKADIAAHADMNTQSANSDGSFAIADLYNQPSSPPVIVWRTDAPTDGIFNAIDGTKYTPVDVPDAASAPLYTARAEAIQIKQMNLQNLTIGRASLNTALPNIRAWLRDCVTALPAGASGAPIPAGGASGATVLNACTRTATRIEALLCATSQGSDTTGTVAARVMVFEGSISYQQIDAARAS